MNKLKLSLFLLLLGISFTSCDDDDEVVNPFAGTDNYITSFTLTKDGTQYNGYISDNQIIIYAPLSQSLEGAVATVKVCEQATVFPDPAGISDWDNERQFKVTAYNESEQTYAYRVVRSSETTQENIVLATQQEVDDFKNSDIVQIMGTLTIGSDAEDAEPITNLDGLSNLKEVSYDIRIMNYSGEDIAGLGNLEIAGGLHIENATALKILSLPKLIKAPVSGVAVTAETLESVSLPALTEAGALYIRSYNLSSLDFSALATVHGDLTLNVNKDINNMSSSGLTGTIEQISFPMLKECGNVQIAGFAAVTAIEIPMLESVDNLSIEQFKTLETLSLPQMKTANDIYIHGANIAEELDFKSLETVTGNLKVDASKIENCFGLSALRTIQGMLILWNYHFTSLEGLADLTVNGGVEIAKASATYTTLDLSHINVPSNEASITISEGGSIDELILPETIVANLNLSFAFRSAFPVIKGVKSAQYIDISLNQFEAIDIVFEDLTSVYSLSVTRTSSGKSAKSIKCANVTELRGLSISNCPDLTTLDFNKLEKLTSTRGAIKITDCTNLRDFSTFKTIFENYTSLASKHWRVSGNGYNPTFDDMKAGRYTQQQ